MQGNSIGTNAAGTSALTLGYGVEDYGSNNTIGGTTSGAGNVISGNSANGVVIESGASGVQVQGNSIGINAAGTSALANGNGVVDIGSDNSIGGTTIAARNIISGNSGDGVYVYGSGVQVQGNYIGTNAAGTSALGNSGYGVTIVGSNNTIGGAGAGNTIAHNSGGGVFVSGGNGNTISQNSIFANGPSNTGPGITLYNGANNNLAAPSLSSATLSGSTPTVTGTFTAPTANVTYVLEFFANVSGDPEGKVYLGSLTVTPKSTGTQSFTATLTDSVSATDPLITATLTNNLGDTSEFSNGVVS